MWGLRECLRDAHWQEGHLSFLLSNYLEYCGKAGKDFLALDGLKIVSGHRVAMFFAP